MDKLDKRAEELGRKLEEFFDKGPMEVSTSKEGPPIPPSPPEIPEKIAEKSSEITDKFMEPMRKLERDLDKHMDKETQKAKVVVKSMGKSLFPLQLAVSPITFAVYTKNRNEHPSLSNDQLIEMTNKEVLGWNLDLLDVIWPGTSVSGSEKVEERVGGLVKSFAKEDIF